MIPAHTVASDDCLRVSTASILEMNPRRVPHFVRRPGFWLDVWTAWLRERGLRPKFHMFHTLAEAPRGFWIAITDEDPNDGVTHALVMRGSRVVYDPQDIPPRRRNYVCGYTLEPLRRPS